MPDERLAELLRQRAILSQHVAWLDAEIARASGAPASGSTGSQPAPTNERVATPAPAASSTPAATTPVSTAPAVLAVISTDTPAEPADEPVSEAVALANKRADEIIANYAATDSFNPESTRRGCMLLASAVFLIGTAILIGIYLLKYR